MLKYEGIVLEVGVYLLNSSLREAMQKFITTIGELLHEKNMILIITVFLQRNVKKPLDDPDLFNALTESVDYFNVMAYDYTENDLHAPLEWAKNSLNSMIRDAEVPASKILMGIPFYGYKFGEVSPIPAMGRDLIAFLKKTSNPLFSWNPESHEHSVAIGGYKKHSYKTESILFPSLFVRPVFNYSSLKKG